MEKGKGGYNVISGAAMEFLFFFVSLSVGFMPKQFCILFALFNLFSLQLSAQRMVYK